MFCPHCKSPVQESDIYYISCHKKIDGPGKVIYPSEKNNNVSLVNKIAKKIIDFIGFDKNKKIKAKKWNKQW